MGLAGGDIDSHDLRGRRTDTAHPREKRQLWIDFITNYFFTIRGPFRRPRADPCGCQPSQTSPVRMNQIDAQFLKMTRSSAFLGAHPFGVAIGRESDPLTVG